jgi:hypothetical protein
MPASPTPTIISEADARRIIEVTQRGHLHTHAPGITVRFDPSTAMLVIEGPHGAHHLGLRTHGLVRRLRDALADAVAPTRARTVGAARHGDAGAGYGGREAHFIEPRDPDTKAALERVLR